MEPAQAVTRATGITGTCLFPKWGWRAGPEAILWVLQVQRCGAPGKVTEASCLKQNGDNYSTEKAGKELVVGSPSRCPLASTPRGGSGFRPRHIPDGCPSPLRRSSPAVHLPSSVVRLGPCHCPLAPNQAPGEWRSQPGRGGCAPAPSTSQQGDQGRSLLRGLSVSPFSAPSLVLPLSPHFCQD